MVLQAVRETGLDTSCHNRILSIKVLHHIYHSRYSLDSFKWDLWIICFHHVQDVVTYCVKQSNLLTKSRCAFCP